MSEKKIGKISYGKMYEMIVESDYVSIRGYDNKILKFYKDKIIVEKENKVYNLNYKMIKTISFNNEKKIMVFLFKKEPGIGFANNLIVVSDMNEEGYNYLMNHILIIKSDFKNIVKKAKLKYNILNIYIPLIIIGTILLAIIIPNLVPKSKSSWDRLDSDQKEWYKRNYGNGQYDKYKNTIDKYKSNH